MSGTSWISRNASPSRSASPSAAHRRVPTKRPRSCLCGYARYHHHGCRRSCSCGLHKQAARAQGRSSVAPPIVGAFVPQASALRRARALSTGGDHGRGSMRRFAPRSGSPQAVCLRSAPSPLRSRSLAPWSFRGLRKPPIGVLLRGGGENEKHALTMTRRLKWQIMAAALFDESPVRRKGRGSYGKGNPGQRRADDRGEGGEHPCRNIREGSRRRPQGQPIHR